MESKQRGHASASYRLYAHIIWPTKYRKPILGERLTPLIEAKLAEVCHRKGYQLIQGRAVVDHAHVLVGFKPVQRISDIVRDLKTNTSKAAFETFSELVRIIQTDVLWAEGYRAESVSPRDLKRIRKYIEHQVQHHQNKVRFRARQDAKEIEYGATRSTIKLNQD